MLRTGRQITAKDAKKEINGLITSNIHPAAKVKNLNYTFNIVTILVAGMNEGLPLPPRMRGDLREKFLEVRAKC